MLSVVIATRNRHKFRELKSLLAVPGVQWHSLVECPEVLPVHEDGRTFDENAMKKARATACATGLLALADDSGLEVEALGGRPGVASARFAGAHGDDQANNAKLLRMLDGLSAGRRGARYRCTLALASPQIHLTRRGTRRGRSDERRRTTAPRQVIVLTHGTWRGRIAERPRGRRGFGYDPIFFVPRFGKTVGQLPASTKQRFSHRAIAARRMRATLRRLVATGRASGRRPATVGSGRWGPGLIV